MLHYTDTTVFNVNTQTIVNTVNCVGVMGAGLALEFQLRFPEMEKDYVERCRKKEVKTGKPYLYRNYGNVWILNFPTKDHWKYPSKIEWIDEGLKYFSINYQKGGITSIAFPKLGCSHGGLDWGDVSPLMEKYLGNLDIDVFICLDQEKEATGVEGSMVSLVNNIESFGWDKELNLRADIRKKIIHALPIRRFRELGKIEGVGKQTYNDMFSFLYQSVKKFEFEKDKPKSANTLQLQILDTITEEENWQESTNQLSSQLEAVGFYEERTEINTTLTTEENLGASASQLRSPLQAESTAEEQRIMGASCNENYDAFLIILPYIEQALSTERTKDEISEMFKLPKKLVGEWLEAAEKLGKVKKLTRPVRYVATSNQLQQQLEYEFAV
jgi:O-acetyl-ADP-ribose deacetylase (regulator of RNase III)/uncharacterized protein Smg (DUF494 family)